MPKMCYGDRPFCFNSSYYRDTPCPCTYEDIDILVITCPLCIIPKCATCQKDIDISNNYYREYKFNEGEVCFQ